LDENNYQVHHLTYLKNRNVWEYPDEFLVTLCKQCHAKEHGITPPSSGWTYMDFDDLGEMSGECEKCHTSIRYQHHLFHPDWGVLTVGKLCADNLTRTDIASKKEKEVKSYANRLKKFIVSNRWESITDCEGITSYKIRQDKYNIWVKKELNEYDVWEYYVWIRFIVSPKNSFHKKDFWSEWYVGKKRFESLDEAKTHVFRIINSGVLDKHVKEVLLPKHYKMIEKFEETLRRL